MTEDVELHNGVQSLSQTLYEMYTVSTYMYVEI